MVFRYNKLYMVLVIDGTTRIKQKQNTKETIFGSPQLILKNTWLKPFANPFV